MKYYLIAGEASGDLHASALMRSIKREDPGAEFRFFGGDMMRAEGGAMVRHYRDMAYMGFVPVLLHLPAILRGMSLCKHDIAGWRPDVVVLVDYPGFNLKMARYVKKRLGIPVHYYISPKIWAWKEYRIKAIKRDVDELYSILPFEVPFFERKHGYPIHYVGNPTLAEVDEYRAAHAPQGAPAGALPVLALLPGSRRQEIKDNLPPMLEAARPYAGRLRVVVAGAPSIPEEYYRGLLAGTQAEVVFGQTYALLSVASLAVVTSGTATLETCLFGVPQAVCYKTPLPKLFGWLRRHVLKVPYVSLVNLVAGREVVRELVADSFSVANIRSEIERLLPGSPGARQMQEGYAGVRRLLGTQVAPDAAARIMVGKLQGRVQQ